MGNRIKLSCGFSFRGEYLTPSIEVDLDALLNRHGTLPDFYPLLAQANQIGLYSYEYEMLQAEPLEAEALEGWVADYIEEQHLDIQAFEQAWHRQRLRQQLTALLVQQQLDSRDERLLTAMEQAFQLGLTTAANFKAREQYPADE